MEIISRKEAIAAGQKRYFTGKPCPKGHVEWRLCSSMACAECAREAVRALTPKRQAKRSAALAAARAKDPRIVTLEEARVAGLQRYFTGKPCKRGHADERWVQSRACVSCTRENGVTEENRTRQRAWARANPDKVRSYNEARRNRDPEAYRQLHKRKRERHADKYAAYKASYTEVNRDRIRQRDSEYRARNADKVRAARERWILQNPEKAKIVARAAASRRRKLIGQSPSHYTANDVERIRKSQRDKCGACRLPLRKGFQIDHINPIARGGDNSAANIQLLCEHCNRAKAARDPIEFMQALGLLI